MNSAVILNIQRFSVHDGPGIRTSVFFKGCPLHCPWCHNPESIDARPELAIRPERCIGCDRCSPECHPGGAGRLDGDAPAARSGGICLRCGACAEACPSGARDLLGWRTSVADLVVELEKDRPFYDESRGGVTFSGGEPVAPQNAKFLLDCLDACRERGLHTVVDTCGHVSRETLLAVAERADLLLYDLKIMDPGKHRAAVGVGNELIHANLRALIGTGRRVWVRTPLIPGWTDDEQNLAALAGFVAGLGRPVPVHLLPHHGNAAQKYRRLGREYELAGTAPLSAAAVERKADQLRAAGVEVIVGGAP